jgi:hypothetical protein
MLAVDGTAAGAVEGEEDERLRELVRMQREVERLRMRNNDEEQALRQSGAIDLGAGPVLPAPRSAAMTDGTESEVVAAAGLAVMAGRWKSRKTRCVSSAPCPRPFERACASVRCTHQNVGCHLCGCGGHTMMATSRVQGRGRARGTACAAHRPATHEPRGPRQPTHAVGGAADEAQDPALRASDGHRALDRPRPRWLPSSRCSCRGRRRRPGRGAGRGGGGGGVVVGH